MKKIFLIIFCACLTAAISAQEFNPKITILAPRLQTVDPKVFETLKSQIVEFFTNTRWTDDVFEGHERIELNINLTITDELSPTEFKGDFSIQSNRPIYNADQKTITFNHLDNQFTFSYEQFQPLIYSPNTYTDHISALLSFYAYIVLGLDYDTFSAYGGEKHLQTAQEIMLNVPETIKRAYPGWRSIEGNRNRYWLIENLLTPRVQPMRQAWYEYHRLALDKMHEEPAVGRFIIMQALETIANVNKNYPNSMIMQVFANSKSQELLDIYAQGTREEKNKVIDLMGRIDPSSARRFTLLRN